MARTHEDDVADGIETRGVPQLLQDLAGREVTQQPHGARGTERAAHLAADLRGDADGEALGQMQRQVLHDCGAPSFW
jgi:hypothetical protein